MLASAEKLCFIELVMLSVWLVSLFCFVLSFFLLSLFGIKKYMALIKLREDHSANSGVQMWRHT
jgi:hypothetical protein